MKVVLDTDIGTDIDDAWALGYALKSPTFELLGVTVTDADTPQRARLACKLLQRLGRTDVPVAAGRQTPAILRIASTISSCGRRIFRTTSRSRRRPSDFSRTSFARTRTR